ncbi:hypothetical protein FNV43_RR23399 [Rhamnella rubrinervis]|uniref:Uncharacterized protein n=1 Tax=Rhamnella rubrinervis TaxID=2594499 RepID=A0A8K0DRY0_9ROSA|nr:hypothetical protein FNV43_RR23399 [Rhamnella rubrinervis]
MAADDQEGVFGFEEGRLWLPSQVLDQPHVAKAHLRSFQKHRHYAHHRVRLPPESFPVLRVFLPQSAGTNFPQTKRTGCAPVLLPNRVVRALNLNVHELGLQLSPRKDPRINRKGGDSISLVKNRKGKDVPSSQCYVVCQNPSSSPELFLPKEWTY